MSSYDTILFKRDTESNLSSSSTVIKNGEPVFNTDNGDLRMGNGSNTWSGLKSVNKKTATAITRGAAQYNNWQPVPNEDVDVVRVTPTADITITGLVANYGNGQLLLINHSTTYTITLEESSSNSQAANRIENTPAGNLVLNPGEKAILTYNTSRSKWIAVK